MHGLSWWSGRSRSVHTSWGNGRAPEEETQSPIFTFRFPLDFFLGLVVRLLERGPKACRPPAAQKKSIHYGFSSSRTNM